MEQKKKETRAGLAIEALQERIGDRAEQAIGNMIEKTPLEVPELLVRPGDVHFRDGSRSPESGSVFAERGQKGFFSEEDIPAPHQWYRVPVEGGKTADGSEYHIYIKKGASDHLCVFLSGGGIAWNPYTAARPVTGGRVLAWHPNYYWSNLRPFTQVFNIGIGITDQSAR